MVHGYTAPDFTIAANPQSLTINAGSSATSTITLTSVLGFDSTVSLLTSINRAGLTASFSQSIVSVSPNSPGTSTLTLSTTSSTPTGFYQVAVGGQGSYSAHIAYLTVTVPCPAPATPDFSVALSPTSATVQRGSRVMFGVGVSAFCGLTGTINIGATISPTGANVPTLKFPSYNHPICSTCNGTGTSLTVSTSLNTPATTYTITIIARDISGGCCYGLTRTVTATLTVA
jgi:hypothetical protein